MKNTLRTFIAIKITPEGKMVDLINEFKKSLRGEAIRWVDNDNLHLTLQFLGETSQEQMLEVTKVLETIPQDFQPFQFSLKGVGFFKSRNQPRVLHITTEDDSILMQLADKVIEVLAPLGFGQTEKTFTPHLTIGRFRYISDKVNFYALVNRFHDKAIQQVTVSEIIFYQSILSSEGPTYKPIKIINLN
ncbi:MAG TPA: RNA 2',3'-cyclic phosphodiesterase [Draconibacterium sp.]|nr:RNA 2',3'-cyclic phosphodiesterase [Draconibacterium sp.]